MFRLTVLLFLTRFIGFIALGYYAFWIYSAHIKVDNTFDLRKVALAEHRDAVSDLKKIGKDSHRSILRSLKSRNENLLLKHHEKVLEQEATLIERKSMIEVGQQSDFANSQLAIIESNLAIIAFFKNRFNRNKNSLRYNFPDTHTNKLNKLLEKYRSLEAHVTMKKLTSESWESVNHELQTIPQAKQKSKLGLYQAIKDRGLYLFGGLVFLFLFDLIVSVLPHRRMRKYLNELKEDRYPEDIHLPFAFEWKKLSGLLNILSRRLLKRSKRLDNILENINVAVFSVHKDGEIGSQYSAVAKGMFPGFSNYKNFSDFMLNIFETEESDVEKVIASLFETKEKKEFDLLLVDSIIPEKLYIKKGSPDQRIITIDFVDKRDTNGNLLEILVFCRDKTEFILGQEKLEEDDKRFHRIQRAAVGINDYFEFIKRTTLLMTNIEMIIDRKLVDKHDELLNDIHELKNNFFMADFEECCTLCLDLEDVIHDNEFNVAVLKGQIKFHELDQVFKKQHDDIVQLLHLQAEQKYISVEWAKLERLQGLVQEDATADRIIQHIKSFKRYPADEVFNKYKFYVKNLEKECNKEIDLVISPDSCELSYKEVYYLDNVFGLLITNSIDHGIEEAMVRDSRLKPRQGTLKITSRRKGQKLEFILKDDGGGIDEEKLMYKAVREGFWTEEEAKEKSTEQIIQLLFDKALSSKDEASKTSGRGIGMNSIKRQVERLGGEILVHSKKGLGTTFIISLPSGINIDDEVDYLTAV